MAGRLRPGARRSFRRSSFRHGGETSPAHSAPWLAGSPDVAPQGAWGYIGSRNGTLRILNGVMHPPVADSPLALIAQSASWDSGSGYCLAFPWTTLISDTQLTVPTGAPGSARLRATVGDLQLLSVSQAAVGPAGRCTSPCLLEPCAPPDDPKEPQEASNIPDLSRTDARRYSVAACGGFT